MLTLFVSCFLLWLSGYMFGAGCDGIGTLFLIVAFLCLSMWSWIDCNRCLDRVRRLDELERKIDSLSAPPAKEEQQQL